MDSLKTYESVPARGDLPAADMTIREYMAAVICAGVMLKGVDDFSYDGAANYAVAQTDELLARLAK